VVAESINGGGGHVALDFNGITSLPGGSALPGEPEGAETDGVFRGGGQQTQNSSAGPVILDYSGTFGAAGRNGAANSAQAIGGGGGTFNLTLDLRDATTAFSDLAKLLGRSAADGSSNGGDVEAVTPAIVTEGDAIGLMMQSIGGGASQGVDITSKTGTLGASAFTLGERPRRKRR
jgi:hypothetical protein